MRLKTILALICVALAAYFILDSLSQPNTATLPGNFRETAMYRNPNNTGPVVRIYAVAVDDTLWNEMRQYGDMMPYTKNGTTSIYFFKSNAPAPTELSPETPHFPDSFQDNCIGRYEKNTMGFVQFHRLPASLTSESTHKALAEVP